METYIWEIRDSSRNKGILFKPEKTCRMMQYFVPSPLMGVLKKQKLSQIQALVLVFREF